VLQNRTGIGAICCGIVIALLLVLPTGVHAVTIDEFSAGITPDSHPTGIAAGPDGNLWFTVYDVGYSTSTSADRIGRITPAGVITEFSAGISRNSYLADIAAGPDGNLWFTEQGSRVPGRSGRSGIGRITLAGVVTEFRAGISEHSVPNGIAAGPDGNLWFTEREANQIGRITPAGVVTEFSAGANTYPQSIAAGPDGNLWFTGQLGISRITTGGVVTGFRSNVFDGHGVTAGPDGNVWFAGAEGIGRVTPAGVVTEFITGFTPGITADATGDITVGPDGNLWFTELHFNSIGRSTPAGTVSEFSAGISPDSYTLGIAAGADGNLWFTENFGGRIGRASDLRNPPPPPFTTVPELYYSIPQGRANNNSLRILGQAATGTTVRLYDNPACAGTPSATGEAAQFFSPGLTVTVADDTTTTFHATASNADGTSPCSSGVSGSVTYVEDSTAPETTITSGPSDTFGGYAQLWSFSSSEPDSRFECRVDAAPFAACSPPHMTTGLLNGAHAFEVRAKDAAGNIDASPAARTFTVNRDVPTTPPPPNPAPSPFIQVLPGVLQPSAAGDRTPPVVRLSGKSKQKAGGRVSVYVTCTSEACTTSASGTIRVPSASKVYRIGTPAVQANQGARVRLKLAVPRKAQKLIKKALRRHRTVRAKVTVTVKDAAGNAAIHRRVIKLEK
jgi:streptogramin lyase